MSSYRAWVGATVVAGIVAAAGLAPAWASAPMRPGDAFGPSPYRVPAGAAKVAQRAPVGGWYDPRWRAAAYSGDSPVLYVSVPTRGTVDVFPGDIRKHHPAMIGQISGLDAPRGIAVDGARNLYVAQGAADEPVLVFAPGSTTPRQRLDTQGKTATDVAVGRNGDVFVAIGQPYGGGVLVYRKGEDTPSGLIPIGGDAVRSLKADRDGNLYVVVEIAADAGLPGMNAVVEMQPLPSGGWRELQMGWRPGSPLPWSLGFDRNDDLVVFQHTQPASFLGVYPAHGASQARLEPQNIPVPSLASFGFNDRGDALYAASAGRVYEYAYGSHSRHGVAVNDIADLGGAVAGIAAAPAPRLPRAWSP